MSAVLQKSQQTRLEDLLSTISLLALEAGHIVSDLQDGQTTDLFAPPVYPANHLVLQERKKELMTNDICYRTLSNSLSSAISKQFLANKYQAQSNTAGSMIYVLKWSEKSTELGRSYSQQQARVRPISDKDCTGWPTASTRDHKAGYLGGRIRNGKLSIDTLDVAAQLAGYPTPKTGTGGGESQLATSNGRESRDQFRGDGACGGMVYTDRIISEWTDPDWLHCRDEKYRPIKPSIEPLANGLPRGMGYSSDPSESIDADNTQEARVMRLKGYGNAIVPQVVASFIKAFMEAEV